MAAPISRASSQLAFILTNRISAGFAVAPIQCKAKSTGVNKTTRTPGQRLGWKRQDGQFVHAGEELVKQKSLRFYPGENVQFGKRYKSLYAMTDGTVIITAEKLSPHPTSPLYAAVKDGLVLYKKFFHIIPTPIHGKFKLVSQI